MSGTASNSSRSKSRLILRLSIAAALVVLVLAMIFNTKFLTPEEVEALTPEEFDPAETAQELFDAAQTDLLEDPAELSEVVPALAEDPETAVEEFGGARPSEGTLAFPVTVNGTVEDATNDNLVLAAEGVPEDRQVVVPLGTGIDGNLVRDLMGFEFGDAPGQTDYQQVATEIRNLVQQNVQDSVGEDVEALTGEEVAVGGVLRYVATEADSAADRPLVILPLELEVAGS